MFWGRDFQAYIMWSNGFSWESAPLDLLEVPSVHHDFSRKNVQTWTIAIYTLWNFLFSYFAWSNVNSNVLTLMTLTPYSGYCHADKNKAIQILLSDISGVTQHDCPVHATNVHVHRQMTASFLPIGGHCETMYGRCITDCSITTRDLLALYS